MSDKKMDATSHAMNALSEVPKPIADAQQVTALVKDSGHVTGYQLSDGNIIGRLHLCSKR